MSDAPAKAIETGAKDVAKAVGEGLKNAGHKVLTDIETKLKESADEHRTRDESVSSDLEKAGKGKDDNVTPAHGAGDPTTPTASPTAKVPAPPKVVPAGRRAKSSRSSTSDYKKVFFDKHPGLRGKVVVHHAIEQQARKRYPGTISSKDMHSIGNLRGIPKERNARLHLSALRKEWNEFYRTHPTATRAELDEFAEKMDKKYGDEFQPPVGDE